MSLLLLHIGLYPWRRKVTQIHQNADQLSKIMGVDYFPEDGLPFEYGGTAGGMKDLNGNIFLSSHTPSRPNQNAGGKAGSALER